MAAEEFELDAVTRTDTGKGASRRLRRHAELVPGIVYGGSADPEMISVEHRVIGKALQNEAFYSHIITLKVDGKPQQVILKDLQRHPAREQIMHLDFLRIEKGHKITVNVPLHFLNEESCPGVKLQGGVVSHLMSDVEVSCLPENLPEFIEVDLEGLELGDAVHMTELKVPEGVEIIALMHGDTQDQAVVNIHKPRAVVETDEEAGEGEGEESGEGEGDSES